MIKIKKKKKAKRMRGSGTHGWGARKKHKGSGHRGGFGMAGTGKRGDQKKSLIIKKYGNKYFGKKGITSKSVKKKKVKVINLYDIENKFKSGKLDLKDYKILGGGEITKKFIIKAKGVSKSAKEKIEKVGGEIILSKKLISDKTLNKKPIISKNKSFESAEIKPQKLRDIKDKSSLSNKKLEDGEKIEIKKE